MSEKRWILLLVGLLACGLLAAGCGDDDTESSPPEAPTVPTDATAPPEPPNFPGGDTSTGSDTSTDVDVDAFYDSCINAAAGTSAESSASDLCARTRDGLKQCADAAEAAGDSATMKVCQDTADQVLRELEGAG